MAWLEGPIFFLPGGGKNNQIGPLGKTPIQKKTPPQKISQEKGVLGKFGQKNYNPPYNGAPQKKRKGGILPWGAQKNPQKTGGFKKIFPREKRGRFLHGKRGFHTTLFLG